MIVGFRKLLESWSRRINTHDASSEVESEPGYLAWLGNYDPFDRPASEQKPPPVADSSPELEVLETASERAARYRRDPLEEVSSPEFWFDQNHHIECESPTFDSGTEDPHDTSRVRQRLIHRLQARLEDAVARGDQETIWDIEDKINEVTMW